MLAISYSYFMIHKFKLAGKEISINLDSEADLSVFEEVFKDGDYKILDEKIKNAKTLIIDIGAHIGCFCVYAAVLNPSVKILVFEPDERNFKLLKENLKLNGIRNVEAKNLAVSSKEGIRILNLSQDSPNHSFFDLKTKLSEKKVQTTTLSKILNKTAHIAYTAPICDLIKMDCEGAEFEILQNLPSEDFALIRSIYIEYHEYSSDLNKNILRSALEKNGFRTAISPSRYDNRFGFILAEQVKMR